MDTEQITTKSTCENCKRLEDQLLKTEESSANQYQKVQRLQTQLEICKEALEFYANEYNYAVEIEPLLRTKIKTKIRDDNETWGYQASPEDKNVLVVCAGKRARECLEKLKGSE